LIAEKSVYHEAKKGFGRIQSDESKKQRRRRGETKKGSGEE